MVMVKNKQYVIQLGSYHPPKLFIHTAIKVPYTRSLTTTHKGPNEPNRTYPKPLKQNRPSTGCKLH